MPGGRVGIIVNGSTQNTDLTINPLGQPQEKGFAQSFAYGEAGRDPPAEHRAAHGHQRRRSATSKASRTPSCPAR